MYLQIITLAICNYILYCWLNNYLVDEKKLSQLVDNNIANQVYSVKSNNKYNHLINTYSSHIIKFYFCS